MNEGAFGNQSILDSSSYSLLFEPQANISGNRSVGLSWFLDAYRGMKTVSHGGGDLGFRSYIIMIPEKSMAVIAASNFQGTPIGDIVFGIIDIMLEHEPRLPKKSILLTMGKTIATRGIQESIELNPDNVNAVQMLERLQSQ